MAELGWQGAVVAPGSGLIRITRHGDSVSIRVGVGAGQGESLMVVSLPEAHTLAEGLRHVLKAKTRHQAGRSQEE